MRHATVKVAGNLSEVPEKSESQQQLNLELFESKLRQERERGARKIQAVRSTCQNLVLNMAKTVKEYFKKTMEDTCRDHRKELQEAREQGIKEGMRRQRDLLQKNMVCTKCSMSSADLFMCSGCWSAVYCGEECQRSHWPTHMECCRGLKSTNKQQEL
ncbi:hypothetical protein OS493_001179 [Desmophyllum pertusum]|uniref:MYND-type domain-containing protein n=1 Tax=Desmophyllum pertusum TaxID=174260 RepID=A0A9W9ZTY1_9CNID|nr:hypothetical protein OS493_001179 [Desmophyllum pertusum]